MITGGDQQHAAGSCAPHPRSTSATWSVGRGRSWPTASFGQPVGRDASWSGPASSAAISDSRNLRCPPGVRMDPTRPVIAHRVTVFGSTRNNRATSPEVSNRSTPSMVICRLLRSRTVFRWARRVQSFCALRTGLRVRPGWLHRRLPRHPPPSRSPPRANVTAPTTLRDRLGSCGVAGQCPGQPRCHRTGTPARNGLPSDGIEPPASPAVAVDYSRC